MYLIILIRLAARNFGSVRVGIRCRVIKCPAVTDGHSSWPYRSTTLPSLHSTHSSETEAKPIIKLFEDRGAYLSCSLPTSGLVGLIMFRFTAHG